MTDDICMLRNRRQLAPHTTRLPPSSPTTSPNRLHLRIRRRPLDALYTPLPSLPDTPWHHPRMVALGPSSRARNRIPCPPPGVRIPCAARPRSKIPHSSFPRGPPSSGRLLLRLQVYGSGRRQVGQQRSDWGKPRRELVCIRGE